jgi:integrase/recombinase XerD
MIDSSQKGTTTSIYLDTRKKRQEGTYSVKLRVTHKRVSRFYATKYLLTKVDFKKVMCEKPRGDFKKIHNELAAVETEAWSIISKLRVFSFEEFKQELNGKTSSSDVFSAFVSYQELLHQQDRIGSETSYKCSLNSFQKFWPKAILQFEEITPKFLASYENWMLENGRSESTVGIYVRSLRRILNLAIKRGDFEAEAYPFGNDPDHYSIPQPRNVKKALSLEDIGKLFAYRPTENTPEHFYRDVWLFSYLCNGINITDICHLKYKDISEDTIQFRRVKTHMSNRRSKPVVAFKTAELDAIINRWGLQPVDQEIFVFPLLTPGLDPASEKARVGQAVKQTNKYIKRVAKNVGIESRISTYTARHSFATVLKRSGVNISYISEALGHTNLQTTESYLGSFEVDEKKRVAKKLTAFMGSKPNKKD